MQKSVEQKLYDAYTEKRRCNLTPEDVADLVGRDDAIRTRITRAAIEGRGSKCEDGKPCRNFGRVSWSLLGSE